MLKNNLLLCSVLMLLTVPAFADRKPASLEVAQAVETRKATAFYFLEQLSTEVMHEKLVRKLKLKVNRGSNAFQTLKLFLTDTGEESALIPVMMFETAAGQILLEK